LRAALFSREVAVVLDPDSELLAGLDAETAGRILAPGSRVAMPAGSVLFGIGAQADNLFLIERGRVSLTLPMQVNGREADLLVEEKSPGQVVGWSAVIPPHRFTMQGKASLDTELVAIPRSALLELFAAQPEIAYLVTRNIAAVVGQRLQVFQAMWLRQMQRILEMHAA